MAAIVSPYRPVIDPDGIAPIYAGAPVSASLIQPAGYLANWLRGKGSMLVPWCFPDREITAGSTETFRFRTKTRSTAIQRVWSVLLRTEDKPPSVVTAEIMSPSGTGTPLEVSVSHVDDTRNPIVYTETLSSKSATEQEITISIEAAGGEVIVEGICCFEQDRAILNLDSTDLGVDVTTLIPGAPLLDDGNVSIAGVWDALQGADARRVGIFQWSYGDGVVSRTSATPANIFTLATPVLARKLSRSATTGLVRWSAYARMASAGTGSIGVATTSSGVSDSVSVTTTSYAWTTPRSIAIHAEDPSVQDGRRSTSWDDMQFTHAGSGSVAIQIKSLSVWDGT